MTAASNSPKKAGILLSNLGTPDSPQAEDVRRYLKQFLSDTRVIKMWKPLWWIILNCIILRTRPARSAHAYSKIWTEEGSPLLVESQRQLALLRESMPSIPVELGMRYGNPSIHSALEKLLEQGVDHFVVLGLYPQFSYTTISSVKDEVLRFIEAGHSSCSFQMICDYHDHDSYIDAVSDSIRGYQKKHGHADRLLMSFHGIPKKYAEDGDPYPEQCHKTARLIADRLRLNEDEWGLSFQSRLGPTEWLRPYTDETLEKWGKEGVKSIQVVCPGFSVDCLETLEEIAMENSLVFRESGGDNFSYIPCLNSSKPHIKMMVELINGKLE